MGDAWDTSEPPLYGCLTGIELPKDRVEIARGVALRRVYVDTFGATMMAFKPPPAPNSPHPAPWAAVRGGFTFEGRTEVELTDLAACDGLTASVAMWLVAAVLRLRVSAPVRLAVLANLPFEKENGQSSQIQAIAFERAPQQIGHFTAGRIEVSEAEIGWLQDMLPLASRLYHEERFFRAFSIFDQAQWAATPEMSAVLVWTAIEILFDLSAEREKTKAICHALSDYVGRDETDRERAYLVIRDLYYKRGKVVHSGRRVPLNDVVQGILLARAAFERVLIDGRLPPPRAKIVH